MTMAKEQPAPTEVAIAHDYLTQRGGAEKVVLAIHRAFPESPIYTTLFEPADTYPQFADIKVIPSPLNRIGLFRRSHRLALPLLAWAAGRVHIDAKHTIVSSSGWAHGFRTTGSKIVYCYSPARWLYQPNAYLGTARFSLQSIALRVISPFLKTWDRRRAHTATKYFAISTVVRDRIRDTYGIEAEVLPAPHTIDLTIEKDPVTLPPNFQDGFHLCISRLLPYKNVREVVLAFNSLDLPLVVVGAGPEEQNLVALAHPNVIMKKDLTDGQIQWLYERCVAVVSASYEDFGLTPIEGAAFGKPAVVLRWGGFLDTIKEGVTGVYFDEPNSECIVDGVRQCQNIEWDPDAIRSHAETFTESHFANRLRQELVEVERKALLTESSLAGKAGNRT